jgi:hypothetical protein
MHLRAYGCQQTAAVQYSRNRNFSISRCTTPAQSALVVTRQHQAAVQSQHFSQLYVVSDTTATGTAVAAVAVVPAAVATVVAAKVAQALATVV